MAASNSMYSEKARLDTFNQIYWLYCRVSRNELARNGLYATGDGTETECNWCKYRFRDWQRTEYMIRGHLVDCSFLRNPLESGNIPLLCTTSTSTCENQQTQTQLQQHQNVPDTNYFVEANRLATFKNWPNPNISPQSLAKAGFYYLNRSDEVKCAWCGGIIARWEKHDNAFEEHKRFFPNCTRVQWGPLIEFNNSSGICELGIQQQAPPKQPKYASLDARTRTFNKWPISHIQQPEALAQAGLYYQGIDDQVRCFHCNIGLRSWQKEDDPWYEHAKWHPQCQFVQLAKGSQYVKEVQAQVSKHRQEQPNAINIDEAMALPASRQALEIGIDGGLVRAVVLRRLQETGCPYDDLDDLLRAVFEPAHSTDRSNEMASCSSHSAQGNASTLTENATAQRREDVNDVRKASIETTCTATTNTVAMPNTQAQEVAQNTQQHQQPQHQTETELDSSSCSNESRSTDKNLSLEEENRKLKDARLCKVCLDEEVGVVFLPCGHLVTCMQCAPGVQQCPMCRADIKGFVRTFLS